MEESYVIKKSVHSSYDTDKKTLFIFNNGKIHKLTQVKQSFLKALDLLYAGTSSSELASILSEDELASFLSFFKEKELLREAFQNEFIGTKFEKQIDYYSEFFNDPNKIPQILSDKKILIIGVGGVGAIFAQHLSSCGIKSYVLVDFDTVNATNLNRQFTYFPKDIGGNKIEKLKNFLQENDPSAKVSTWHRMIKSREDIANIIQDEKDIDFIACCADMPQGIIQKIVSECARDYKIPCSFCGVHLHYGTWGPLLCKNGDYEKFVEINSKLYNSKHELRPMKPISASIGFTNSLVSSLYSKDIIMFLLGHEQVPSLSNIMKFDFRENLIQVAYSLKDSIYKDFPQ